MLFMLVLLGVGPMAYLASADTTLEHASCRLLLLLFPDGHDRHLMTVDMIRGMNGMTAPVWTRATSTKREIAYTLLLLLLLLLPPLPLLLFPPAPAPPAAPPPPPPPPVET